MARQQSIWIAPARCAHLAMTIAQMLRVIVMRQPKTIPERPWVFPRLPAEGGAQVAGGLEPGQIGNPGDGEFGLGQQLPRSVHFSG